MKRSRSRPGRAPGGIVCATAACDEMTVSPKTKIDTARNKRVPTPLPPLRYGSMGKPVVESQPKYNWLLDGLANPLRQLSTVRYGRGVQLPQNPSALLTAA